MLYLNDYFDPGRVFFLESAPKTAVLDAMIAGVSSLPQVADGAAFAEAVRKREALVSTGVGAGVAIPHVKSGSVSGFFIAVGVCPGGIDWDALDGGPVQLIFLIGGPEDHETYLRILAKLSLLIKNPKIREAILEAGSPEAVCAIFGNR